MSMTWVINELASLILIWDQNVGYLVLCFVPCFTWALFMSFYIIHIFFPQWWYTISKVFSFFCRPPQPKQTTVVKYSESRSSQSDDEPTKKAVADRFSMWEKKTGDALTPLRQGTPLRGARATPAKQSGTNMQITLQYFKELHFLTFHIPYTQKHLSALIFASLRTRFPVVRSTWNLDHIKFAQLAPQNRQIEQIAQSRSCGRSLENHENWVLGDIIAGTVL